jgi:hypothetical protein
VDIARMNEGNIAKAATGDPPALAIKALKKPIQKNRRKAVWHSNAA